ncbi:uncharacterized protein CIMG_00325 [Coccidioides immitis RS]|uniref:Urease accessory protein UreD n=4 Tax=Coccidioides immitis TaxID=5501 RepID=J3KGR7_COCIM|nr:uncharacterized protein CIMG_00325 [Coccidioides immitis RS]EAS34971.3 hypothetical protein CIMG_00325 [Coccidioides immitis RS]KMP00173.1 hypothetical protein CIRG_00315 [Coccidioides immitis RMSCC 2394]KMU81739.1 hypothetical protein CISG_02757 [Coccidioides immitis RMSCC 3703]KMU84358.1 hypothetical protein CIHG_02143 [Coccidioides immitis H538.4]
MPHKHKRRRKENDDHYDLPPNKIAKPLPARLDNGTKDAGQTKNAKQRKKPAHTDDFGDDTPRQFARMMRRFQQSMPGGKDGNKMNSDTAAGNEKNTRKRKRGGDIPTEASGQNNKPKVQKADAAVKSAESTSVPKILPGEKLSDYAARVDQALPLSGVARKAGNTGASKMDADIRNLREHRQTKHEKRLLRLQKGWREEEAKIREKEEAEREEREAEDEEVNDTWKQWEAEAGHGKKKKKKKKGGKKKKKNGAAAADGPDYSDDSDDDDPWAKLNKKKCAAQPLNPFDVVQAPPENLAKVKEIFKVHGINGAKVDVANVPAAAGSLRRREELASHRQSIVEEYRRIMAEKRGQ